MSPSNSDKKSDKTVFITMVSSLFSGSVAKLFTHPIDTVKAKIQVVKGKFGWTLNLETLNLGGAENPKSKSIKASQAIIPSTLLTYFF